jgi:hypothetical protein
LPGTLGIWFDASQTPVGPSFCGWAVVLRLGSRCCGSAVVAAVPLRFRSHVRRISSPLPNPFQGLDPAALAPSSCPFCPASSRPLSLQSGRSFPRERKPLQGAWLPAPAARPGRLGVAPGFAFTQRAQGSARPGLKPLALTLVQAGPGRACRESCTRKGIRAARALFPESNGPARPTAVSRSGRPVRAPGEHAAGVG